jgi:hypothetical protein
MIKQTRQMRERELKRTSDRLLRGEAEEMIEILAAYFNVTAPTLRWSLRSLRGQACLNQWWISAGPLVWRGTTNCLLHEFAHLLAGKRALRACKLIKNHGPEFIAALQEVAEAWHGDVSKYGWNTEYKTVMAAGAAKPTTKREVKK